MVAKRADLREWILDESNTAHNKQAMYFLFDHAYPWNKAEGACAPMMNYDKTRDWITSHAGSFPSFNTNERSKKLMIRRLEADFIFTFLFDERDLSKRAFEARFNRTLLPIASLPLHESNRSHNPVDAEMIALIRERNALDVHLVQHVRKMLSDQVSRSGRKR